MTKRKHQLRDSGFFRLQTKSRLARLLQASPSKLRNLSRREDGYFYFTKSKTSGGHREICAPVPSLKSVQSRLAELLSRIAPPDYLFSPVARRSYVDNAACHIGARSVHLLDIKDFFPNCTFNKVIWFFRTKMQCSPDVAHILARIATHKGALPQGSPCSPILAYFAYIDMWEAIDACVAGADCVLSVYVDDLTISGDTVPKAMILEVKHTLKKHGHRHAVEKERARRDRSTEVTGVILTRNGVTVPNRQRKKICEVRDELRNATSPELQKQLESQLRGRLAQVRQVDAGNRV